YSSVVHDEAITPTRRRRTSTPSEIMRTLMIQRWSVMLKSAIVSAEPGRSEMANAGSSPHRSCRMLAADTARGFRCTLLESNSRVGKRRAPVPHRLDVRELPGVAHLDHVKAKVAQRLREGRAMGRYLRRARAEARRRFVDVQQAIALQRPRCLAQIVSE